MPNRQHHRLVARGDHATALAPRRGHVHTEENPVSPGFLLRALKITVDLYSAWSFQDAPNNARKWLLCVWRTLMRSMSARSQRRHMACNGHF